MGGTSQGLGLCVLPLSPCHRCPKGHFGALALRGRRRPGLHLWISWGSGIHRGASSAHGCGVKQGTIPPSPALFLPLHAGVGITWIRSGVVALGELGIISRAFLGGKAVSSLQTSPKTGWGG